MKRMEDDSCKITESQQEDMALVEAELSESKEKCRRLEAEVSSLREESSNRNKQIERKLKVGDDLYVALVLLSNTRNHRSDCVI